VGRDDRSVSVAVRLAGLSALTAVVANSALLDRCARRVLPGLSSAGSVVPLAFLSLFSSEFPLQLLAVEASVGVALAPAVLRRRRGRWALTAVAISWLGLLRARRRSQAASVVLDDALKAALGEDYRAGLPEAVRRDTPLRLQDTWIPTFSERRRYLRHADLSYGPGGVRNVLDIWYRDDLPRDGRAPVLVQIHGSAWVAGSKRGQGYPLMAHMAERGWVCVAINYSLAPRSRWPAHIIDVKRAVAWVKSEIDSYGGDPDFIALTGGSAGGHLTALAALTGNEPTFQPGFEDADTTVAAAVPFYGIYDLLDRSRNAPPEQRLFLTRIVLGASPDESPELWSEGSPMHWAREDAPPFFVLHGSIDTLTPPSTARAFADRLAQISREPVVYAELPGAQHMWEALPSVRTAATVAAVDRFLTTVHRRHLGSRYTGRPA
jgi:acetyl esterase/lipase